MHKEPLGYRVAYYEYLLTFFLRRMSIYCLLNDKKALKIFGLGPGAQQKNF